MSATTEDRRDSDVAETDSHQNVYSPASSNSTFSREVKYIFNPVSESNDEYMDYSHINSRSKQNYMSHTPHITSSSSQLSCKENRTPHHPREKQVSDPLQQVPSRYITSPKSSGVQSRMRLPISPHVEESYYYTQNRGSCKASTFSDHTPKDGRVFSPEREVLSPAYMKPQNTVVKNNMLISLHPESMQKQSNLHHEMNSKNNRNSLAANLQSPYHNQHPQTYMHTSHYKQLSNYHPSFHEPSHPPEPQIHEPPYPMPPRYSHQHHSRRKTWSPPALKLSLVNASSQASRVCYSNDSLDISETSGRVGITHSLSEDLDVTPPRLAPVSGVLSQKPGQNLIKPIAFKPVHLSSAVNTVGHVNHTQELQDATTKPAGVKQESMQESPDQHSGRSDMRGLNSVIKFHHPNSTGSNMHIPINSYYAVNNINHPHLQHSHSVDSPFISSPHNSSSVSSHHSIPSNSSNNIPVSSHATTNSSHLSATDETSISSEFPCPLERPDSIPSLNISRVSSRAVEGVLQTPSPSDSGVGELEAMLREKDAEINTLREVMERNERAIFQVYEERRNIWLHETQDLQNEYERRLKVQSRKSYKTEQVLSLQVYKLQQEQQILEEEKANLINERDMLQQQIDENKIVITHLKQELESAMAGGISFEKQMEEADSEDKKISMVSLAHQEELSLKNKEIIILKSQLHSLQSDMEKKNRELAENVREVCIKTEEVNSLKDELSSHRNTPVLLESATQTNVGDEIIKSENIKSSILGERDHVTSTLRKELVEIQAYLALLKEEHEKEREQWLDEKNKVIRYQKQLQLNYVQMQRKNTALETEVEQLTLELENRDMKLIALSGEESIC